jgi:hypothetical protein
MTTQYEKSNIYYVRHRLESVRKKSEKLLTTMKRDYLERLFCYMHFGFPDAKQSHMKSRLHSLFLDVLDLDTGLFDLYWIFLFLCCFMERCDEYIIDRLGSPGVKEMFSVLITLFPLPFSRILSLPGFGWRKTVMEIYRAFVQLSLATGFLGLLFSFLVCNGASHRQIHGRS